MYSATKRTALPDVIKISSPGLFRVIALALVVWVGGAGWSFAGLGSGVSSITSIDTEPPTVTVDQFPPYTIYFAGEMVTFHWETSDSNPGQAPEYFTARVWVAGQVDSTLVYHPDISDFTWEWIVPDIYSNAVHVEVEARDAFGNLTTGYSNDITIYPSTSAVPAVPVGLELAAPAPNPFNPSTRLSFNLPEAGQVSLTVYDARGHRVRTLLRGQRADGAFTAHWDGRDDTGRPQSGGVYVFVLDFQGPTQSGRLARKAVLIP
jgi:hypothetical protein